MTDRVENITPVGSVPPVKLRKIRRRGEDGQGQNHTWRELLEDEMKFTGKKKGQKQNDNSEEKTEEKEIEQENVKKESDDGHLDVIA